MDDSQFARLQPFFIAFGNKDRFEILRLLASGPKTVTELYTTLGHKQTKTSNDLRSLRECGYVQVQKVGNTRHYSIQPTILNLLDTITTQIQLLTNICDDCVPNSVKKEELYL